jgi:microcystin-dependent protein
MAKLTKSILKIFGINGNQTYFDQFGSLVNGGAVNTKDISTIQQPLAWTEGLQAACFLNNKAPFFRDWNSLLYVLFYQIYYGLEEGIPEWDSETNYFVGSVAKKVGGYDFYTSLIDNNLNNPLPTFGSNAYWQWVNAPSIPTGAIREYGGASSPIGWLLCDGSAVSRNTYANLFNSIGTTWGAGDGSTTFNLPDFRGRASIGAGQGSGLTNRVLAQTLGEEGHALSVSELPAHSHTVTDPGHFNQYNIYISGAGDGTAGFPNTPCSSTDAGATPYDIGNSTTGITLANAGSGTAHNNMQPSIVFNKIIKT